MTSSSNAQTPLKPSSIALSALHLAGDISGLPRQSGIQLLLPRSNASDPLPFKAIISESTSRSLILSSFHAANVTKKNLDGVEYVKSSLADVGISRCAFTTTVGRMHGQPPLDDQTAPPFKVDGVTRIPFTHQGHFFSPEFFVCDHIFCRQEFELQFVAVLGLDFLQHYFVRTQWTETGWAIQLPPPTTGRIEELSIYTDGCCLSNGQVAVQGSNVSSPQGGYGIHFPSLPNGWDIHSALSPDKINTNQRAELTAVIRALQIVRRRGLPCGRIALFTDSDYAVQGLNEWIPRWRQRGYRTSKNRGVVNADLFRLLDQEASLSRENGVPVKITHVLRESNQRADALSKLGATSGRSELALRKIDPRGFGGILGRPLMEETKPLVQWSPDSAC